jgi:anti-sigma factor RsiW
MACAEFEDLLLDYADLSSAERVRADGHVAGCTACREFLAALQAVDTNLMAQYSHRVLDANFDHALKRRIQQEIPAARPSLVPELLDFIGWAGILALVALIALWISPLIHLPAADATQTAARWSTGILVACAAFVMTGFWVALRSFADLKH